MASLRRIVVLSLIVYYTAYSSCEEGFWEEKAVENAEEVPAKCRVRKEFLTGLTKEQRAHYISTVKKAATTEPQKTKYENLLTVHRDYFNKGIHTQTYFLPWHRWFLVQYENILREIDSDITVPYWDWSLVANEVFENDFWAPDDSGFGGNGDPLKSNCVQTGPFREDAFSLIQSAGGGCLKRGFNGRVQDAVKVQELLRYSAEEFSTFEKLLRTIFHNNFHCCVEKTMCSVDAASAPEFLMHHGFIEKIWSDWQKKGSENKFNTFFMKIDTKMPATKYLPREYLDLHKMPDNVCVVYEDPISDVFKNLQDLSLKVLENIPNLRQPDLSPPAIKLFKEPCTEVVNVSNLGKRLRPNRVVEESELKGQDAVMGFEYSTLKKVKLQRRFLESIMDESRSDMSETTQQNGMADKV
ncbi:putative tyrosinase-like protein tyr-3 [Dendronephthya gigantea]|uniref:putative tyrosinase-like protein tyr-3 n=1 Tax=Dendronephthya gigantea TaxID=151771 RepID=UPI00106D2636|nr:putative tyrosinase-like protein tyr-3 [Dendronephthya gigantea]